MAFKDILVYLTAGARYEHTLRVATALAERHGAVLTGICVWREPGLDPVDGFAAGVGISDVLHRETNAVKGMIEPVAEAFRAAAQARGVETRWVLAAAFEAPEDLALHARLADLAVLSRPRSNDHDGDRLAERLALTSGAPCLVVPEANEAQGSFDRIVATWDGGSAARRAIEDALPFLKAASQIELLAIDDGVEALPHVIAAEAALGYLIRHGAPAKLVRAHRPRHGVGAALLDHCHAVKADLLVMGAYGRAPAVERLLGGATRHVLSHATLPVLMSH